MIALVLLVDIGTDYGGSGPGSFPPMFDGRAPIVMTVIYIMALVTSPFLPGWTAWTAAAIAIAAAFYTVNGVVAATGMLGIMGGMIGMLYLAPALMLLVFSGAEAVTEISARRKA